MGDKNKSCKHIDVKFSDRQSKFAYMCRNKNKLLDECDCDACDDYVSRYIEFPIAVNGIDTKTEDIDSYCDNHGQLVYIRLPDDAKTYTGILLGELPYLPTTTYDSKTNKLTVQIINNPAIYVPDLKRVAYGAECWWRKLEPDETPHFNNFEILFRTKDTLNKL